MRFQTTCDLLLLVALALCALKPLEAQQQQQQPDGQLERRPQHLFGGLIGSLTSPLRAIGQQARGLLGRRADSLGGFVQDNLELLQANAFKMFARVYNKTYSARELPKRMRLFFERRKEIEESVRAFAAGQLPFMMRENAYLDWDEQELRTLTGVSPPKSAAEWAAEQQAAGQQVALGGAKRFRRSLGQSGGDQDDELDPSESLNLTVLAPRSIPAHKDWRLSGCVAAPVNQQKCGCCYAIATVGVLESMRCLRQVSSPTLSAQQIVDCATPRAGYQNFGCNGGWPTRALKYLQDKGVAARDSCYPLVLRQEVCKLNRVKQVPGCTLAPSPAGGRLRYKVLTNERDILYHVANTGPVITVMRATDRFLYYGSGIFDDPKCSRRSSDVDHAIAIVGYGRENGQDYWLIKNSWGAGWGQQGYGKYRRGTNACSIGHWAWVILD